MDLNTLFTEIAQAIREQEGSSGPILPQEFPERIRALSASAPAAVREQAELPASKADRP